MEIERTIRGVHQVQVHGHHRLDFCHTQNQDRVRGQELEDDSLEMEVEMNHRMTHLVVEIHTEAGSQELRQDPSHNLVVPRESM